MTFPPKLSNIENVVINSSAQVQPALHTGISSIIIPNILDLENPPSNKTTNGNLVYEKLNLEPDDIVILQLTRIVQRKGIEQAIDSWVYPGALKAMVEAARS